MYSRKSVGPKMEPSKTPPLTKYYCGDFPTSELEGEVWPNI